MANKSDKAEWEMWFERYRGTELALVVLQLTRVALERGRVTAEDSHCIPVRNPNLRGAAMRSCRRLGILVKKEVAFGTTDASHGHMMFRWELADARTARGLLGRARAAVLREPAGIPADVKGGQVVFSFA